MTRRCASTCAITARWHVVDGDLVFGDVRGESAGDMVVFESHPWKPVRHDRGQP